MAREAGNPGARLAVLLFAGSETIFFLVLISAYVFYHFKAHNGAEAARYLDTLRTGGFSLSLFASSATTWRAGVSLRAGHRRRVRAWLLATVALGAVFLVGQGTEYAGLIARDVTVSRDLFGTTFFTLTGFHGLHVLAGLVMLAILFLLGSERSVRALENGALEGVSIYWHFVDAVWVVIFAVVYLWSAL